MDIWVVGEVGTNGLEEGTLESLGEGRVLANSLGVELVCILLGDSPNQYSSIISQYDVDKILLIKHPLLSIYSTDGFCISLTEVYKKFGPARIIFSASSNGQDLAARLAARLHLELLGNCIWIKSVNDEIQLIRRIFSDRFQATYASPADLPWIASLIPNVAGIEKPHHSRNPIITEFTPHLEPRLIRIYAGPQIPGNPRSIAIEEAEKIVAGGRGVRDRVSWGLLEELGETLGAAVGGSRRALDLGYISSNRMIGQTGHQVKPQLYISVGISGMQQHLGGVASKCIISINTDRNAPIIQRSTLGIIADLHAFLPLLINKLLSEGRSGPDNQIPL